MIDTPRLGAHPRDKHRRVGKQAAGAYFRTSFGRLIEFGPTPARDCTLWIVSSCNSSRLTRLFLASTRPRRHHTNSNDFVQPFAMGANNEWSLSRRNACRRRRVQHRPAHRRLSVHRSSEPASCRPRALHHLDLSLGCGETFLAHASPQNFSCTLHNTSYNLLPPQCQ